MRDFTLASSIALATVASVAAATPAYAQELQGSFSIAPMPLASALKAYAIQSGDQVLVPSNLGSAVMSSGVSGAMSRDRALSALLQGTGFVAVRSEAGVVSLRKQAEPKARLTTASVMNVAQQTSAAAPAPQPAQQAVVPTGQIIVTARKREERLQDIPASIAALDESLLKAARVERVDDLTTHVPNLTIVTRTDATPDVTLRGVGSFGVIQTVGFYVNDVQQFDGQTSRFRDIERVEVLKGPQGTLYSGSNIGGAIRFMTKRPDDFFEGELAVEYGTDDFVSAEGILSGPLSDDVGARLLLYWDRSDGYTYNATLGAKAGPNWIYGGRLTLEADIGPDTTATLFVDVNRQKRGDLTNLYITPDDDTYSTEITQDTAPELDRRIESATLDIRHDFGGLELVSLTSGFHSYDKKLADFDFTPMDVFVIDALRKRDAFSQEFRLGTTGTNTFNWLVGAFGQYFEISNRTDIDVAGNFFATVGEDQTRKQLAFFGNGELNLGELTIEAGLRYEMDWHELTVFETGNEGKVDENELLYRGSLSYKASPDVLLYTTIAKGFTPGDLIREGGFAIPYGKETAVSWEAGVKGSAVDGRLRFEGAGFVIWYDDRLFTTNVFDQNAGNVAVTNNIGKSRNMGVEMNVSFDATDYLTFGGALGLTQGEWTEGIITEPNSGDTNFDLDGLDVPYTPDYQGTVFADLRVPVSDDAELGFHADAAFVGRKYWNLATTTQQRAYQLVNLSVRIELPQWEFSVSGKNIFDARYNTLFQLPNEIGNDFGDGFAVLGQPRQVVATARARF